MKRSGWDESLHQFLGGRKEKFISETGVLAMLFFPDSFLVLIKMKLKTGGSDGKASAYNVGDLGSIPGLGRSPGEGNGNPLQYSCLENSMDGGTW